MAEHSLNWIATTSFASANYTLIQNLPKNPIFFICALVKSLVMGHAFLHTQIKTGLTPMFRNSIYIQIRCWGMAVDVSYFLIRYYNISINFQNNLSFTQILVKSLRAVLQSHIQYQTCPLDF